MPQATITITDETNCKINNLDLGTRRTLQKKFSYEIPGARFTPAVRLGRWDGTKAFCSLGAATYINLLPEILPILVKEGYDIDIDDQRTYSTAFQFTPVNEQSMAHQVWPKGHPVEGQPIMLRDYQVSAINEYLTNVQGVQSLPTGAGKTLITAVLSKTVEQYGKSIVIVPSKDLVRQTEADYINLGLDVGVLFGDRKEYNKTHTIATWQSLNSFYKREKEYLDVDDSAFNDFLDGTVCVMVDEAHSAKADVLLQMLTGPFAKIPIRWGLTGTIPKEEFAQKSLLVSIGPVINHLEASELQDKGVLANCNVNVIQMQDYVEYKDFKAEQSYLLGNEDRLEFIANMVANLDGNTLVLVDRISAGTYLEHFIVGSKFISGSTKSKDRKNEYDEIATSDSKTLIATYGIAAVGINVPRINHLVLIEPGKSFVRVIQSIGRGLRKASDKDHVEIWDFCSSAKFSKRHLTTRKKYYVEVSYPYTVKKVEWK